MLLTLTGISKRFGDHHALRDLSLQVRRGELLGIVGPDGAGKTTLLRIIAGALSPSTGRIESRANRAQVGYLSQHFSLYPDLTVAENVAFFASIYGLHEQAVRRRGRYLLQWVGLWEVRDRLGAQLSGGMKQKLSLACALVHQADLMLLDEPTTAVDPISRREFWDLIQDLIQTGTTVLISTPYMEEADRCHRVAFLSDGRLLACDTPAVLRGRLTHAVLEVRSTGVRRGDLEAAALRIPGALAVHAFGDTVHVMIPRRLADQELVSALAALPELTARPIPPSLEDVFIGMINRGEVGA